jgi:uncharacterized membrane protein affecting hemolysin expression
MLCKLAKCRNLAIKVGVIFGIAMLSIIAQKVSFCSTKHPCVEGRGAEPEPNAIKL